MEPFHVTCETCHSRLKIRSEDVIGQIHSCPKCESMVHIVPPLDWAPITATAINEEPAAEPAEAIADQSTPLLGNTTLLVCAVGGSALLMLAGLAGVLWWPLDEATSSSPAPVAIVAAHDDTAPPESPVDDEPLVAQAVDQVPSDEVSQANDSVASEPSDEPTAAESGPKNTAESEVEGATTVAVDDMMAAPAESPVDESAAATPQVAPTQGVEGLAEKGQAEVVPGDESTASEAAAAGTELGKPIMKFDPLDFATPQLSLGGAAAPLAESTSSVSDATGSTPVVAVEVPPPADGEVAAHEPADESFTVRVGPNATDARRLRNVSEQLGIKIEAFDFPAVPLARFAEIIAEMTDVPITIDLTSLELGSLSPRATVALSAGNITLGKLLRDAVKTLRLDYAERDGQLMILHPNLGERRTVTYEVKDLLPAGADDASPIAALIRQLVAPDSWKSGASGGTVRVEGTQLQIEQANRVQIQTLLFCERLRMARGLAARSRYPRGLISIDSPYVRMSAALKKPTTFTLLPWTRLADVVRLWQASSGMTILVDWTALAKEELAPGTPITCSVINRPWDEALDSVLEPLGLTWWAVDGETIQITSRSAAEGIECVEFYAIPKDLAAQHDTADGLVPAIEKELLDPGHTGDKSLAGRAVVRLDEPSKRLIVTASPVAHRHFQRKLAGHTSQRPEAREEVRTNASPLGTP